MFHNKKSELLDRCLKGKKWEIKVPALIHPLNASFPPNTCCEAEAIPQCMHDNLTFLSHNWLKFSSINFTHVFKQNET